MTEIEIVYKKRNGKLVPVDKAISDYCSKKSLERREAKKAERLKQKIRNWNPSGK